VRRHTVLERVDAASGRREWFRPHALRLSSGDRWRGLRLERRVEEPGATAEGYWLNHVVVVYDLPPAHREVYRPGIGWQPIALKPRSIEILPAHSVYASRWDGAPEALVIELAPELLIGSGGTRAAPRACLAGEDPFIAQTALALEQDLRAGSPSGIVYGESLGSALAAHLVRWHTDAGQPLANDARPVSGLDRVLDHINNHLDTSLPLQHLADLVQMDVYRFARVFKQATGMPPHQYVLHRRIELAKRLLRESGLPVMEVALRSGFADQSHFTTVFRRLTRLRPSAYRSAAT